MTRFLIAFLLAGGAGQALGGEPINETRSVEAGALIVVKNVKGEIQVEGWDRNEVSLTGELGDGSRGLEIEDRGSQLLIQVEIPRNARSVEETVLYLQVPETADLEVESVSARIDVTKMRSQRVATTSVSGDAEVDAEVAELEMATVSGDIEFSGRASRAVFNTVSGDVDAEGIADEVRATTVSGEVYLKAGKLSDARFETVSGDLELYVDLAANADLVIESLSGDVDLNLPKSLSATCEAESFSGSIRSDRGEVRSAKHGPHKSLSFVAGDGDARIRIESFSGDLRIRSD